jgi:hypothetical protein
MTHAHIGILLSKRDPIIGSRGTEPWQSGIQMSGWQFAAGSTDGQSMSRF